MKYGTLKGMHGLSFRETHHLKRPSPAMEILLYNFFLSHFILSRFGYFIFRKEKLKRQLKKTWQQMARKSEVVRCGHVFVDAATKYSHIITKANELVFDTQWKLEDILSIYKQKKESQIWVDELGNVQKTTAYTYSYVQLLLLSTDENPLNVS